MNPSNRLRQNALTARNVSLEQRVKSTNSHKNPQVVSNSFDADLGLDVVQLNDGTTKYASALTNGVRGVGEELLLHESRGITAIDAMRSLPKIKRTQYKKRIVPPTTFEVWIRLNNFLLLATGNSSAKKLAIKTYFKDESNEYINFGEPGFANIKNNKLIFCRVEFPSSEIYLFDLSLLTFTETSISATGQIDYVYSCCANGGTFFAVVDTHTPPYYQLIYIHYLDGNEQLISLPIKEADSWSIAAPTPTTLYLVGDYKEIYKFDLITGVQTTLTIDSELIESTFVFADYKSKSCYLFGIKADLILGVPLNIIRSGYRIVGISNIQYFGYSVHIVQGDFTNCSAGDSLVEFNYGVIIQVLGSSAYIYFNSISIPNDTAEGSRPQAPPFQGGEPATFSLNISTESRQKRSTIWRINSDNSIEEYFKFPGINNEDGYQNFYNFPCRGAVIDPKTKDIYMVGSRTNTVINGIYIGDQNGISTTRNFITISKNKKFSAYDLVFEDDAVVAEWDWNVILENI